MEPMTRSAYAFCHGERSAVRTSWIPIPVAVGPIPRRRDHDHDEIARDLVPGKRLAELCGGPVTLGHYGFSLDLGRQADSDHVPMEKTPKADGWLTSVCSRRRPVP